MYERDSDIKIINQRDVSMGRSPVLTGPPDAPLGSRVCHGVLHKTAASRIPQTVPHIGELHR
jgi:hypothetical protein